MRALVVGVTIASGCLLQACGGSSRLRCGEGTEERRGECVAVGNETGGTGTGGTETGGRGGSESQGGTATGGAGAAQGGASGASNQQGGSAGTAGAGAGGATPQDPPEDPTPDEVAVAQERCALPESGIVPVSDIPTLESLLIGRWLRCDGGAMFFGREDPGIRFDADYGFAFFQPVDDGGLASGQGFDHVGTWVVIDNFNGTTFQTNLRVAAGENFVFPIFATDPPKMRLSTMLGTIDFAFIGER